jgi:rhomboid protease GluP
LNLYFPKFSQYGSGPDSNPDIPQAPVERELGKRVMIAPPKVRPVVSYTIMAVTIIVYLLQVGSQTVLGYDLPALYGTKVNALIAQGQYWRLLTPMLLHASILHIGFNMYALYILGPGLERYYGNWRFLGLYVVSGFAGNVFSMIFTPAPSLGSSTAIFGVFAAEGMFFFQNRRILGQASQRALMNIVILAVINFVISLSPGIDMWGHVGGFLAGGMFAFIAGPVFEVRPSYPSYELVDQRSPTAGLVATLLVGGFFVFLTFMTIAMG